MSPINGLVLGGAALVASPALYAGLVERSMPLETALTRYLVAVGVCWVLLSLLVDLALPSRETVARAVAEREKQKAEREAEQPGDQTRVMAGEPHQPPA